MNCLPGKARRLEGLDKKDVVDIFAWGGSQRYKGKFEKSTTVAVRARTRGGLPASAQPGGCLTSGNAPGRNRAYILE